MSNNVIELTKLLADKNLLNVGMTISAKVPVRGFGNIAMIKEKTGIITNMSAAGLHAIFEGGKKQHTKFEDIITIEGMDVPRFAQAYRIKPNKKSK